MKINSGFLRWIVAAMFPMALLNSQACFSAGQENRSESPPAEDVPLDALPPVDSSRQTPYGRQPQYQGRSSSAAYHQPVYHRNWFRRSHTRMPHFIKLPPVEPPAVGENLNTFWAIQIANGEAARMVLYHFDFVPGQPELTARGTRQLSKFADMLQQTPHSLMLQPSPEQPRLDELRRDHVLNALAMMDVHVPEERIIIRIPQTRGLDWIDAEKIQLKQPGLTSGNAGSQGGQIPQTTPVATPNQ